MLRRRLESKPALLAPLLLLLASCVSSPLPEGYTGPTATIKDSSVTESNTRAAFFYLAEVDGRRIANSVSQTKGANQGRGMLQIPVTIERKVPAGQPLKLKLEGRISYGAPIQEMVMFITMYTVDELIEFEPKPDTYYFVRGFLRKDVRTIWLEDAGTGSHVGKTLESTAFDHRAAPPAASGQAADDNGAKSSDMTEGKASDAGDAKAPTASEAKAPEASEGKASAAGTAPDASTSTPGVPAATK